MPCPVLEDEEERMGANHTRTILPRVRNLTIMKKIQGLSQHRQEGSARRVCAPHVTSGEAISLRCPHNRQDGDSKRLRRVTSRDTSSSSPTAERGSFALRAAELNP